LKSPTVSSFGHGETTTHAMLSQPSHPNPESASQARPQAFAVFGLLLLVYLLTEPPIPGKVPTDYSPNSLVPVALLTHHSFDLKPYDALLQPHVGVAIESENFLVSFFPIGAGLSALPFYIPDHLSPAEMTLSRAEHVGRIAAAFLTAASAAILLLILVEWISTPWAVFLTLVYGLGTCAFSILNKGLWQHGPAAFWITLALYASMGQRRGSGRWGVLSGAALGMAVLCRPTNIPFLLAALLERLVRREFRPAALILLGAAPVGLLHLWYNIHYLGGPFIFGGYDRVGASAVPNLGRAFALCFSPGRGLFVFLPFLVLLPAALWLARRVLPQPDRGFLASMLLGSAASLLLTSGWHTWWGGYSYGPRLLSDFTPVLVLAMAPLAHHAAGGVIWRRLLLPLGIASILIHTMGALVAGKPIFWDAIYMPNGWNDSSNLWHWKTSPIPFYAKVWWRDRTHGVSPNARMADGCAGSLRVPSPPLRVTHGEFLAIPLVLKNHGSEPWWNIAGIARAAGEMHLSYRWLKPNGEPEVGEGIRTLLWDDVAPGASLAQPIFVAAPSTPGDLVLRVTLVSAGMRWCDQPGGTLLDLPIRVD
jgi:hypothetical protein